MNNKERNFYNAFIRIREFGNENSDDFPANSAGANNFAIINSAIAEIEEASATQISGSSGQAMTQKNIALAELRENLRTINRTARALAVDNAGIGSLFLMPTNNSEQNLLSTARAFLINATPLKNNFLEYGLPTDFLDELTSDIQALEESISEKNSVQNEKISATAVIGNAVSEGLEALRRLRAIIPNTYRSSPAKLAAWTSASHIERSARKKTENPPVQ